MTGPFWPWYYSAPIVPTWSAYNWDVYPYYKAELDALETYRGVIIGRTWNLPNPQTDTQADLFEQEGDIAWIKDLIGPHEDPTEPAVEIYYPIVKHAANAVSSADSSPEDHKIVGSISMTIFWREFLKNILSPGSDGMVVVIGNDCNQTFTYQIFGSDTKYLGKGDLHDPEYNSMSKSSYLQDLSTHSMSGNSYTGFHLSTNLCPYHIKLYASDTMKDDHESNNALIFMFVAVTIFVFTSAVFILYDCVSERRQKKVLSVAEQSSAVVSSLFPKVVRDRIFPTSQPKGKQKSLDRVENARLRLQQFLNGDGESPDYTGGTDQVNDPAPIAELFLETTVSKSTESSKPETFILFPPNPLPLAPCPLFSVL
jgi:hypothetical protein